ncbi:MAG: HK97 family phage prohead protease [Bacteroidia bacterium]
MYNEERSFKIKSREENNKKILFGTPIVFNVESKNLGGFKELIMPQAFTNEDIKRFDIRLIYQHNETFIPLARSNKGKGSLNIYVDSVGVHFRTELKQTAKADEIYQAIKAGDLDSMSFSFSLKKGDSKFIKNTKGEQLHVISKFEDIKEFSIVNDPAYSNTTINSRAYFEYKKTAKDIYWKKYDSIIDNYKN